MNSISRFLTCFGVCASLLAARGAPIPEYELTAAIHALQQAPDPSAAVAAYANGVAIDRNSPTIHEAYVARMIDFGLPEMAYRQARTLTGLVSSNGLAWGVLAYVDARRGDMTNAVSEIVLAGRFGPEHPFVQRTAGEIIAWYDLQADKSILPAHVRSGLEQVRSTLRTRPTYVTAYDTARKAYLADPAQVQPQSGMVPPSGPSLVETNPPQASLAPAPVVPPTYYYTEPYYGAPYYGGTVWVDPDPYWWRPVGYFSGLGFVPYSYVFLYHRHGHHHRRHHRDKDRFARHSLDQLFGRRPPHGGWHRDGRGRPDFYGPPAQPKPSAIEPSWTYLQRRQDLTGGHPNTGVSRNPSPAAVAGSRSWSGLNRATPSWEAVTPRPSSQVTAPRQPSWSTLDPGRAVAQPPPVRVPSRTVQPRTSPAPSWSTLGSGSSRSSSSSGSSRSSSGSSRPSWSTLDR